MPKLDNKLSSARSLDFPSIGSLAQTDKFKPKDSETLYRFSFGKSSSFDLSLSGLAKKTNADVELYRFKNPAAQVLGAIGDVDFKGIPTTTRDTNVQLLASAKRKGNRNENLAIANLDAGEYVVRVVRRSGKSRYKLQMGAVAIGSPITEETPPLREEKPIDTTPPTAVLSAANLSTAGGNTYDFTIIYNDNSAVNVASLNGSPDKSDIQVTSPNGFSQFATFVSVNDVSNGDSRVATYRITAPGGTWDDADNGNYTVTLQATQVSDPSGNFAEAASLGSFLTNIPLPRRTIQASGGSNGMITDFLLKINVLAKRQDGVFKDAIQNFKFRLLNTSADPNSSTSVFVNVDLGTADLTPFINRSDDFVSDPSVSFVANFPEYRGRLPDGRDFTIPSSSLIISEKTDDPSGASQSLSILEPSSTTDDERPYLLFYGNSFDSQGNAIGTTINRSGISVVGNTTFLSIAG